MENNKNVLFHTFCFISLLFPNHYTVLHTFFLGQSAFCWQKNICYCRRNKAETYIIVYVPSML